MKLSHEYPPANQGRIVVWGLLASQPFGGMTWQVLHYLVGLRSLGFDVWYVEDSDRVVLDPVRFWPTVNYEPNVAHLARQMRRVGLEDRWVFRPPEARDVCLGASDLAGLRKLYEEAHAALNLCGAQELRAEHTAIRRLIYLQTDPTADQVRVAQGDRQKIEELDAYDCLFTYGENIGAADCLIPVTPYRWKTTRPPVLVDWWGTAEPRRGRARLTTITNWNRFPDKDVTWHGETWSWNKQDEIRRFIRLPSRSVLPLELAIGGIDTDDEDLLRAHGWRLTPATDLADPDAYRTFIQESLGELTIAKEQYVRPRSGWFSDRSACYLAAGRPVVLQDTGFGQNIPIGEGLFAFTTEDEALAAIEVIASDYSRQSAAALEIAREYFDAQRVLSDMLRKAGLLG